MKLLINLAYQPTSKQSNFILHFNTQETKKDSWNEICTDDSPRNSVISTEIHEDTVVWLHDTVGSGSVCFNILIFSELKQYYVLLIISKVNASKLFCST